MTITIEQVIPGARFVCVDDGTISTVQAVEGRYVRFVDGSGCCVSSWLISWFLEAHKPLHGAPAASQHPADLKPRGVKAPMYLIPWGAVPAEQVPPAMEAAAKASGFWPDGDRYRPSTTVGDYPSELFGHLLNGGGVKIEDVARVFAYGAAKYARDNWRTFTWDNAARDEYFGAICRHLTDPAELDPESGLPHRAHAACGALIWAWHEGQK